MKSGGGGKMSYDDYCNLYFVIPIILLILLIYMEVKWWILIMLYF
jgi:hypothetical protein